MHVDDCRPGETTRRGLIIGFCATGLSACTSSNSLVMQHVRLVRRIGAAPRRLTREEVAKFQAASIAAGYGGREILILLDRIEGRNLFWLSTDSVMLVTRGGRLIQTAGFANDLAHTSFPAADPVDGGLLHSSGQMSVRLLDYDAFGTGLFATSKYRVEKKEPITILGATIPTLRISEKVRMRSLKWYFRNTYWVHEETGQVWKSRQHFHPDHRALTITTMRPVRA